MGINKEAAINFIKERSIEPSTWRGLINLVTACGVIIEPQYIELIIAVGLGLSGFIGAVTTDKK